MMRIFTHIRGNAAAFIVLPYFLPLKHKRYGNRGYKDEPVSDSK